uniref:Cullin family profile domain-containing protein n=1 Tax=Hemiselmis tepida TaxID=464990 RepID=A0A7S0Z679_9CRYP|mmetsp:Transcript_5212/g.13242  ORF Transcript_5212/g.13242 Transcript_5212/m.13242 type:complete len:764 (+) Transcript_5212:85-2376(+)
MSQPPGKKGPLVMIHAFKPPLEKDKDMVTRSWDKLKSAILKIFNEEAGELSFEELYRTGYNMVLHKHGDRLYQHVEDLLKERSQELCAKVETETDVTFLDGLKREWQDHKRSLRMVRDILMYMDRTFVKQNTKKPVYDMGVHLFCQHCVRAPGVKSRLITLLLSKIEEERNGNKVDRDLVKNSTQMLMEMGRDVFHDDFEVLFLKSSEEFYRIESENFINANGCPEYLQKVERRLQEEQDRVGACLSVDYNAGEGGIKQVVEHELIGRHMQTLIEKEGSGLVWLLENRKVDDLRRMFDLFSRIHQPPSPGQLSGLDLIENRMAEHVMVKGREIVGSGTDSDGQEAKVDHLKYVTDLLDLKDQYDSLIKDAFKSEKSFINKLHKTFECFINQNPRSPEYISLAMDNHLRGGKSQRTGAGQSEEQVEGMLEKALQMFRFLSEKDVFERYYKQHLAKRLLSDRSQSSDTEQKVIQMLKSECGYQFTAKLEGMFKDINTSKTVQEQYRNHLAQAGSADASTEGSVDLVAKVLTTGYWPTQQTVQCNMPQEIDRVCNVFKRFYLAQHNGRQLTWQVNMGNAEVTAKYDKPYRINMPTYQMVVLLLFADPSSSALKFTDIEEATKIPAPELKRVMQSLACAQYRLLTKDPKSKDVSPTDKFTYNSSFTHKMIKFKVSSIATSKETSEEVQASRNKINEDRNPQIDAAVVRVMKTRRVMEHNLLIAEVTKQLQNRFVPEPLVIKRRLEGLIDREFLQRQKGNMKVYEYLA